MSRARTAGSLVGWLRLPALRSTAGLSGKACPTSRARSRASCSIAAWVARCHLRKVLPLCADLDVPIATMGVCFFAPVTASTRRWRKATVRFRESTSSAWKCTRLPPVARMTKHAAAGTLRTVVEALNAVQSSGMPRSIPTSSASMKLRTPSAEADGSIALPKQMREYGQTSSALSPPHDGCEPVSSARWSITRCSSVWSEPADFRPSLVVALPVPVSSQSILGDGSVTMELACLMTGKPSLRDATATRKLKYRLPSAASRLLVSAVRFGSLGRSTRFGFLAAGVGDAPAGPRLLSSAPRVSLAGRRVTCPLRICPELEPESPSPLLLRSRAVRMERSFRRPRCGVPVGTSGASRKGVTALFLRSMSTSVMVRRLLPDRRPASAARFSELTRLSCREAWSLADGTLRSRPGARAGETPRVAAASDRWSRLCLSRPAERLAGDRSAGRGEAWPEPTRGAVVPRGSRPEPDWGSWTTPGGGDGDSSRSASRSAVEAMRRRRRPGLAVRPPPCVPSASGARACSLLADRRARDWDRDRGAPARGAWLRLPWGAACGSPARLTSRTSHESPTCPLSSLSTASSTSSGMEAANSSRSDLLFGLPPPLAAWRGVPAAEDSAVVGNGMSDAGRLLAPTRCLADGGLGGCWRRVSAFAAGDPGKTSRRSASLATRLEARCCLSAARRGPDDSVLTVQPPKRAATAGSGARGRTGPPPPPALLSSSLAGSGGGLWRDVRAMVDHSRFRPEEGDRSALVSSGELASHAPGSNRSGA